MDTLDQHPRKKQRRTRTVTKLTNVTLVRDGKLVVDDLWFTTEEVGGRFVDAAQRFWASDSAEQFHADVVLDGRGSIVVPGFVDVQLNGGFGIDFTSSTLTEEDVDKVAKGILAHGVTSFLPTVITAPSSVYQKVLPLFQPRAGSIQGAAILGVHCEGPFISKRKKGAHPEEHIISKFVDGWTDLERVYGSENLNDGTIRMVTIAPELPGAAEAIQALSQAGVVVSAGHTTAGVECAQQSVKQGVKMVTHLFNAMAAFHHRDPGLVGLIGCEFRPYYGIIVDGLHVHPSAVRTAFRTHPKGCVLVTDAMAALGLGVGRHKLSAVDVQVEEEQSLAAKDVTVMKATVVGTDTLAGAVVDMESCFRNLMAFSGCSVVEAAECASTHPAKALGLSKKGKLQPGCDADFLLLDPTNYRIRETWVGGRQAWSSNCK